MSDITKLYDLNMDLSAPCSCGKPHSKQEHERAAQAVAPSVVDPEALGRDVIESAMVRALFPDDRARRRFLGAVGKNTEALTWAQRTQTECRDSLS